MRHLALAVLVGMLLGLCAEPLHAQENDSREKRAQTTMKFLQVPTDPRAAALGNATTAVRGASAALFANPAGMAYQERFLDARAGQTQWIADIDYNTASLSVRPGGGRWGVIGFTLVSVDYGDLQRTIVDNSERGYAELGTFSPSAMSVGVGYARALTDRFAVGGQVKYVRLDLGESAMNVADGGGYVYQGNDENTLAYDFGMFYQTGFRSLVFAVTARNFAPEVTFAEEGAELPLSLKIGLAMDMIDLTSASPDMHQLVLSVDAVNPRDYYEQVQVGGEYVFMNTLSLRAGYGYPTDEKQVSLGAGLQAEVAGFFVAADYAYTDFGIFNSFNRVHHIALTVGL